MAKKFNFSTGDLPLTNGQPSSLSITGTIERISSTKVKVSAYVESEYAMYIDFIYFHIAYGTTYGAFKRAGSDGDTYYKIGTSTYTEMTPVGSTGGVKVPIHVGTVDGNDDGVLENYGFEPKTIFKDREFTVPDNALYFSIWFHAPAYYHVNSGSMVYNVTAGKAINTVLDRYYTAPSGYSITTTASTTDSITVKHSWTNGSSSITTNQITVNGVTKTVGNGSTATFTGLKSNTSYSASGKISDGTTNLTGSSSRWTYPVCNLDLELVDKLEHDRIKATASAEVSSSYDQFAFKLDSENYSNFLATASKAFGDLEGHSTHTIKAKMKNSSSGYESAEVSKTITTWYDPIADLSVDLVNRWFWLLKTKASFTYSGTISKYEFKIGASQEYQDRGTTNSYTRGTSTGGDSENLSDNTDYTCSVRLTDNHGRQATASATYKTLDERPLYVNGELREVKLIKPDGSVRYITPNLLTVVKENGTTVNMNKIINNDNRTSYS